MIYMVLRTDDLGNTLLVRDNLTENEASRLVRDLTASSHKQNYEVLWYQFRTERSDLLRLKGVREIIDER